MNWIELLRLLTTLHTQWFNKVSCLRISPYAIPWVKLKNRFAWPLFLHSGSIWASLCHLLNKWIIINLLVKQSANSRALIKDGCSREQALLIDGSMPIDLQQIELLNCWNQGGMGGIYAHPWWLVAYFYLCCPAWCLSILNKVAYRVWFSTPKPP